jgi:cell division protein ZapA
MACEEGQEAHLEALAKGFDAKIAEMRRAFGEIGDMRLHVMAALTFLDELGEIKARLGVLEAEHARVSDLSAQLAADDEALRQDVAAKVNMAAARIERLSATLSSKPR